MRLSEVAKQTTTGCPTFDDPEIRAAIQNSLLKTLQSAISAAKVRSILAKMQTGKKFDPVLVDRGVLLDGHHRQAVGLMNGQPPGQADTEGFLGPGGELGAYPFGQIRIDP